MLRQDQFAFDQFRVIDTVIMGNHKLWSALQERELLYAKSDLTEAEGMRLGQARRHRRRRGRLRSRGQRGDSAAGSRHTGAAAQTDVSAGRTEGRVLRKALFGRPEALLLDEPTNHLDLDSIHWVREFLLRPTAPSSSSRTIGISSTVSARIADIDYRAIIVLWGYDDVVWRR